MIPVFVCATSLRLAKVTASDLHCRLFLGETSEHLRVLHLSLDLGSLFGFVLGFWVDFISALGRKQSRGVNSGFFQSLRAFEVLR